MDINEKIAQRRREIEAQKIIDAPIEQAIIQQEVQKNLEAQGHAPNSAAPEHLTEKISEATERALNELAMKRFTAGQWFALGSLVGLGVLCLFGPWVLSVGFFFWAWKYFKSKLAHHRFLMRHDPAAVFVEPGGFKYAKTHTPKK